MGSKVGTSDGISDKRVGTDDGRVVGVVVTAGTFVTSFVGVSDDIRVGAPVVATVVGRIVSVATNRVGGFVGRDDGGDRVGTVVIGAVIVGSIVIGAVVVLLITS